MTIRIILLVLGIIIALAGTIMVVVDINDAPYYLYNGAGVKLTDSELCELQDFILTTPILEGGCSRGYVLSQIEVVELCEGNYVSLNSACLNGFEKIPYFDPMRVDMREKNHLVCSTQILIIMIGFVFIIMAGILLMFW